jgi:hypothetical protein
MQQDNKILPYYLVFAYETVRKILKIIGRNLAVGRHNRSITFYSPDNYITGFIFIAGVTEFSL